MLRQAPAAAVIPSSLFVTCEADLLAWHVRCSRSVPPSSPSAVDLQTQRNRRLRDKLRREFGSDVLMALADPAVVGVVLNADGELWVERLVSGVKRLDETMSRAQAESLLGTVAALADTEINAAHPLLEVELPFNGSRFHGVVPPVSSTRLQPPEASDPVRFAYSSSNSARRSPRAAGSGRRVSRSSRGVTGLLAES